MKIAIIIIVAYLLAGVRRIFRDIVAPPLERPGYVINSRRFLPVAALFLVTWLPTGAVLGIRYRQWDGFLGSVIVFVLLAMAGIYWFS